MSATTPKAAPDRAPACAGPRFRNTYAALPPQFHSPAQQVPLREAHTVSVNDSLAGELGLDGSSFEALSAYFNGEVERPGAEPVAMAYGGHQFGTWVPQLGDGRGLLLGEVESASGDSESASGGGLWDLHIKGAGTGQYSRGFDGRAVLRSSIREYLCSEAMHALGVPTTRALCLISSSEPVQREQVESGALLVRVARTHVRFGSFEYFHYRDQPEEVRQLADYTISRNFPQLTSQPQPYRALLAEVIARTARTIAAWQAYGFCHGVMNTDNMSIVGETLDYGPFGFLDRYNPGHICNTSDRRGRYAYNCQPRIGLWNCHALAAAWQSLVPEQEAKQCLAEYESAFMAEYLRLMRQRLGLSGEQSEDLQLVSKLLEILATEGLDYSHSLRQLAEEPDQPGFAAALSEPKAFEQWKAMWLDRAGMATQRDAVLATMRANNPAVILRNWLAQRAIVQAQGGDYGEFHRLLAAVEKPFECDVPDYIQPSPEGAAGISLSCSS